MTLPINHSREYMGLIARQAQAELRPANLSEPRRDLSEALTAYIRNAMRTQDKRRLGVARRLMGERT